MKHRTRISAWILTLALLVGIITVCASDPVVTRSYLTDTYQPYILQQARQKLDTAFAQLNKQLQSGFSADSLRAQIGTAIWRSTMNGGYVQSLSAGSYTVSSGAVLSGGLGTTLTLVSGSAQVIAAPGAVVVDITEGVECANGQTLSAGHSYMIVDTSGTGIRAVAAGTVVTVSDNAKLLGSASGYTPPAGSGNTGSSGTGAYTEQYLRYAQALQEMGLFKGTNAGFELNREATRVEALVMLIRLLGEEEAALASTAKHPFKDVPSWASRYVAYAYAKGYTNGISATSYGATQSATREQYLTFLLRALGYDDAAGDFVWSQASSKAVQIGMLSSAESQAVSGLFYRDHVAFSSYKALMTAKKDATVRLLDILIDSGTVAIDAAYRATVIVG